MSAIRSHSALISDEDASPFYALNEEIISNRIARLETNGLTENGFVDYITDRINWVNAGAPGTFHDFRNANVALSA